MSGHILTDQPIQVDLSTESVDTCSFFGPDGPPTHVWDCFKELVQVPRIVPPFRGTIDLRPVDEPKHDSEVASESEVSEQLSVEEWFAIVCEFVSGQAHGEAGVLPTGRERIVSPVRLDEEGRVVVTELFYEGDEWNFAAYRPSDGVSRSNGFLVLTRASSTSAAT